jgi:hypothetical protein
MVSASWEQYDSKRVFFAYPHDFRYDAVDEEQRVEGRKPQNRDMFVAQKIVRHPGHNGQAAQQSGYPLRPLANWKTTDATDVYQRATHPDDKITTADSFTRVLHQPLMISRQKLTTKGSA